MQKNHTPSHERMLPGFKPVLELLSARPESIARILCLKNLRGIEAVAAICHKNGIPLEKTSAAKLDSLCADCGHTVAHQGIAAMLAEARFTSFQELLAHIADAPLPLLLALDQIHDPGNLGTLCRTAWALGAAGIILPRHNSSSLGAAAYKASGGTLEKMPFSIVTNLARALDAAEETGMTIYGTGHKAEPGIPVIEAFAMRWQLPAILVLGNENKGIRPGVAKRCGMFINIPFAREFDSLNIAQAGAILLGFCSAQSIC